MEETTKSIAEKDEITYHSLLFKKLEDIAHDTHYTREHQAKNVLVVAVICLLSGVVLGMNFEMWKPIAVDIYHTADVINNLKARQ